MQWLPKIQWPGLGLTIVAAVAPTLGIVLPIWLRWAILTAGLIMIVSPLIEAGCRRLLPSSMRDWIVKAHEPAIPRGHFEILTGYGPDYENRSSSRLGGIVHVVGIRLNNGTGRLLTGGRVLVSNLSPPDNAGERDFLIRSNLSVSHDPIAVTLATHNNETCSGIISLQYERVSGLLSPSGRGMLAGQHNFDLRFVCDQQVTEEIHCRLFLDSNNVMRLQRV